MRAALILFVTLTATGCHNRAAAMAQEAGPALRVTYLANMGVLLEGGGHRVVIDGFHHGELAMYAAVPPALLGPLESGSPPFERIDLILTTHRHLDHFAPGSVASRLRADRTTHFVAASETVDTLLSRYPEARAFTDRIHPVRPAAGGSATVTAGPLEVVVFDLPHNAAPSAGPANVGFLIRIGGLTVLHIGDAFANPAAFNRLDLPARGIDLAIVPFWYLDAAPDLIRSSIAPRRIIASHIPPADTAEVRARIERAAAGAIVLATPGTSFALRP